MNADASRLKRLLAEGRESELQAAELAPDGRYQLHPATCEAVTADVVATLTEGFAGRPAADFPLLVLAWGKCRVGSTALTNLFGVAGVRAYYQPVKTIARHLLTGGRGAPWLLPDGTGGSDVIFAKEMAGPYVHYETIFDPLGCLLAAGWPADRLHLLVLDREPRASLNSWIAKWEGRIGRDRVRDNFELSSLNYSRMRASARAAGVAATSYPYEASRSPQRSVGALFDRIGIADRYSDSVLTGWGEAGDLNSDASMIVHPVEPEPYFVPGLHGSGDGYGYRPPAQSLLTEADEELAASEPLQAAYRVSLREWDEVVQASQTSDEVGAAAGSA